MNTFNLNLIFDTFFYFNLSRIEFIVTYFKNALHLFLQGLIQKFCRLLRNVNCVVEPDMQGAVTAPHVMDRELSSRSDS